ncbi:DUF6318 family protein [Demequina sp. NBRC 110052]|uniref:DUF6318 family protein n=1 Tax=Demequina sp. NBRC 110052 TaxID=1570341 RepID=UPI000A072413|nr:DUF6318 family protein [Demequina sp. NBRC 110052]
MPDTLPDMGATTTAVRAAGALVLVALLAGCTGDDGIVTTTPTPTVEASDPTPSPTVSPSDDGELTDEELLALMPEAALELDPGGAFAAAVYWVQALGEAYERGDTSVLRGLSLADCTYCVEQAGHIDTAYADGATITGGAYLVDTADATTLTGDDGFTYVELTAEADELVVHARSGEETQVGAAGQYRFQLKLLPQGRIWRVAGVFLERAE